MIFFRKPVPTFRDHALGRSDWGFRLLAETPQLKSLGIDCFLDRIAREIVRRLSLWCDNPSNGPGTMLRREFAAARIAGEGVQFLSRLGLENVDAHGLSLSDLRSGLKPPRMIGHQRRRNCLRTGARGLVPERSSL